MMTEQQRKWAIGAAAIIVIIACLGIVWIASKTV